MRLKFRKAYFIGITLSIILLILDYFVFWGKRWFYPGIVVAITMGWMQFWFDFIREGKRQKEIELKFLEFVRNLVENVKSGIPLPKAILQVSGKDYGALNPYIKKLAYQTEWGIPVPDAFLTLARDTENYVIKRAVAIIIEAEKSGGDIGDVLMSVAGSLIDVKKMKQERRASVYSQIVQGYIVYFVFIGIMLALQLWLFPQLTNISGSLQIGLSGFGGLGGGGQVYNLDKTFFALIMIQGFFAGIMIGKFSEGTLKQGLIHSLILITSSALIITTAKGGI